MNKKERFCDVLALQATKGRADNIVEWRHIIIALLALVTMTGKGQDVNTCQPIAERILTAAQNHEL